MAWLLNDEAARYYDQAAQDGTASLIAPDGCRIQPLYARFAQRVIGCVFRSDTSISTALRNVRIAKQKSIASGAEEKGFNVKLGRGGIRESSSSPSAGRSLWRSRSWLRAPPTLISLGRLADAG